MLMWHVWNIQNNIFMACGNIQCQPNWAVVCLCEEHFCVKTVYNFTVVFGITAVFDINKQDFCLSYTQESVKENPKATFILHRTKLYNVGADASKMHLWSCKLSPKQ